MRALLPVMLLVVLHVQSPAQSSDELHLDVHRILSGTRVSVQAKAVPAFTILARLAAAAEPGAELKVDPKALIALQEAKLPIHFDRMLIEDAVTIIGGAVGLQATYDRPQRVISVSPEPAEQEQSGVEATETGYVPTARQEFLRRSAIKFLQKSLMLPGVPDAHEALYKMAMMHLRAGEWEPARSNFARFAEKAPAHDERVLRALYLGGACAVRKPRSKESVAQASDLLLKIPELSPEDGQPREKLEAYLLLARILMQEAQSLDVRAPKGMTREEVELEQGRLRIEAKHRLGHVMLRARGTRLEALALLLKTEIHFRLGETKEAIGTLERFHVDMQRQYPDLALRLPFIRGLCLHRNGQLEAAAISLMTAFERDPEIARQVRAGFVLGRIYLALDRPVQALGVVQSALQKNGETAPRMREKLLFLRARIQTRWEARDLAVATLEELLANMDPTSEAGVDVNEAFRMLATMMFEDRRYQEAKEVFDRFVSVEGHSAWARYMSARCADHMGDHERALQILDGIPEDHESSIPDEEICVLRSRIYTALGKHSKAALALTGWREKR